MWTLVVSAGLSAVDAFAQSYPVKPIRLYVGYTPGGGVDYIGRVVAQKLSEAAGQQVLVINLPGATGAIAVERVVKSPADGYTLLLITAADTIVPAFRAKLPYDLARDLVQVSPAVTGALMLVVHPSVPARNAKELIALARAHPRKLNYGSSGVGNSQHLAGELLKQMARIDIVHVTYKGTPESVTATVAGEIEMGFPSISTALPLVEAGRLRLLAVTSARRVASMPSVPTLAESALPGYNRMTWYGVSAPAGVPAEIVARLNAVIGKGMQAPDVREALARQGFEAQVSSPEQFGAFVSNEIAQNAQLVKRMSAKTE